MALTPGTRLGVYEITAPIGEGGMGQVFRARDTKLNRDVALKVLPDSFANDADRLARFTREAQTLASLNHPNIAHIHGLEESGGVRALVMELVEGDDLSQRIARGAIPIDEALPIAKQIAEALEAAHEQGIIHRDLKPANIKVRPDGTVKVLDFGLAKAMEPASALCASAGQALSMSPTITTPAMTQAGMILGTAAYMSPEQARGTTADKRADLWAFGVVLWEMLTGTRLFEGATVSDTLAAVLKTEPTWNALGPGTPPAMRRLLRRCLEKDRKRRLDSSADARLEIEEALTAPSAVEDVVPSSAPRGRLAWIASLAGAVVVIIALSIAALRYLRETPLSESGSIRFEFDAPAGSLFGNVSNAARGGAAPAPHMAVSPDGRRLAYVLTTEGKAWLWVRRLDALAGQQLPGTEDASFPFWSPDNRFVAFFAEGQLKKIDVSGGPPVKLCDAPAGEVGTWSMMGDIVFAPDVTGGLSRVAASGGVPSHVTTLDPASGETSHRWPQFLPDGRHFLYVTTGKGEKGANVFATSLDSTERTLVLPGAPRSAYAAGHLLFVRDGTLMAQPFDTASLGVMGEPVPIAEDVAVNQVNRRTGFAVSESGILAFRTGIPALSGQSGQLTWYDRSGRMKETLSSPTDDSRVRLSPDEKTLVVSRLSPGAQARDLWMLDLTREAVSTRFTFSPDDDSAPIWSPDGASVIFRSAVQQGGAKLFRQTLKTSGGPDLLLEEDTVPWDWSPDGRFIAYTRRDIESQTDLWVLPVEDERKPQSFLHTAFDESMPRFSPDGRWIAYVSDEGGNADVYVRSFPASGHQVRVSVGGGLDPHWRRDGRELVYLGPQGQMMAVDVKAAESFDVGVPKVLFETRIRGTSGQYALSADGQRFLINELIEAARQTPITILTNWTASVRR